MRENISGILVITGCNKPAANEKQFSDSRKNSCFEAIATALSFLPRNDSRRRTGSSPGGDAGSGACKPNVGRSCDPPDRCLMGFDSLASLMHQDGRLREDVCVYIQQIHYTTGPSDLSIQFCEVICQCYPCLIGCSS